MSTPHRTEINRANSQHSTGPKTAAGKQRSSLNALRHGLTGQIVVMPTEDLASLPAPPEILHRRIQPQRRNRSQSRPSPGRHLLAPQPRRRAGNQSPDPGHRQRAAPSPTPRNKSRTPCRSSPRSKASRKLSQPEPPQPAPLPSIRKDRSAAPRPPENPPGPGRARPGQPSRHHGNVRIQRRNLRPLRRWLRFFRSANQRRAIRARNREILAEEAFDYRCESAAA